MRCDVSVVIPAHNAATTIARTVESVLRQTLLPAELIVVDDCSSDETIEAVQGVARRESDVRITVVSSKRRGAGAARNLGVERANTEYIAFLDADDLWYPDKLERQWPLAVANGGRVIVGCLMHYLSPAGQVLGTNARFTGPDDATAALSNGRVMPLALSGWLLRREHVLAVGGFDESFRRAQDFELAYRLSHAGLRLTWPENRVLMGYLVHAGGVTAQSYREQFLAAELVRARHRGLAGAVSYDDWIRAPQLSRDARRRARSGRHYRAAAVHAGAAQWLRFSGQASLAVLMDPFGVWEKLRWRLRGRADLVPDAPPPAILKLMQDN